MQSESVDFVIVVNRSRLYRGVVPTVLKNLSNKIISLSEIALKEIQAEVNKNTSAYKRKILTRSSMPLMSIRLLSYFNKIDANRNPLGGSPRRCLQ